MRFAFDCETHLIAPGLLAPPLVCMTWAWQDGETGIATKAERPGDVLAAALDSAEILAGANTAFDMAVMLAYAPSLTADVFRAYEEGRVLDVQINEKLGDIARGQLGGYTDGRGVYIKRGYSLAEIVNRRFGKDRSWEKSDPQGWRLRYAELDGVTLSEWPAEAVRYAVEDSADTLDVLEDQWSDRAVWGPDAAAQARAYFALHLLSTWGIKTSAEAIARLEAELPLRFRDLTAELERSGLVRGGKRNLKAARARIVEAYHALGVDPPLTATGQAKAKAGEEAPAALWAALDEEACENSGDPLLRAYSERTRLQTIVETHIPDLKKGTSTPIQARWDLAESGRVTCQKGRGGAQNGFQLTNPPRVGGIRECFVARSGYYFADADFSGLELCTVAQGCIYIVGFSRLGEALNAGLDAHLALGADLAGISYAEAVERKHERAIKEFRQLAKVANFGFPGGLGPRGFVAYAGGYGLAISLEKAQALRAAWLERWPEFAGYFAWVRDQTEEAGVGTIAQFGSGRVRGLVPYTALANTVFQGLGADGAKAALWAVTAAHFRGEIDARPVNFVHDQIIAEVPSDAAHENATAMGRLMVEACNRFLPDVPVKCEPHLATCWSKDAEPVYDRSGRLLPWDLAKAGRWPAWYSDGKAVQW